MGCTDTVVDNKPVGGDTASPIEQERFVRRMHLDLAAMPPSDTFVAAALADMAGDGSNTAAMRASLADGLLDSEEFALTWVDELTNASFGGDNPDGRYDLYCSVLRDDIAECIACGEPTGSDPCGECDCQTLVDARADRALLDAAADDLRDGVATTSAIERRYADSIAFGYLTDQNGTAMNLFEVFLNRPAEPEELANAASMIIGTFIDGSPAGLLFHSHGSDYYDLMNIVFGSEIYREAVVIRAFERYLGRLPTQDEITHFAGVLDLADPDVRPVVRAIVSSREYFDL
jgi:hypothetical protein